MITRDVQMRKLEEKVDLLVPVKDLSQEWSLMYGWQLYWIVFYRVTQEKKEKWVYLGQLGCQGLLDSRVCLAKVKMENR